MGRAGPSDEDTREHECGEQARAAPRRRTKRRGRANVRNEEDAGLPSPSSYDSVTRTRIECLTLKNGPCAVSRRRGVPAHSRFPSLCRNNDRVKGMSASIVSHRAGCMPSAHLDSRSAVLTGTSTLSYPGRRECASSKVKAGEDSRPMS